MSVYNDMAHDGGEAYGTEGNRQLAEMIEADYERQHRERVDEQRREEHLAMYGDSVFVACDPCPSCARLKAENERLRGVLPDLLHAGNWMRETLGLMADGDDDWTTADLLARCKSWDAALKEAKDA